MRAYHLLEKAIIKLSEVMGLIATVVLLGMMLITVTDIVGRYFFTKPVIGCTEMTEVMMVCVGFLGVALCGLQDKHIKIEILVDLFPQKIKEVLIVLNYILVAGLSVFISWRNLIEATNTHRKTLLLHIPHSPFYFIISLGFFVLFLVMIVLLIKSVRRPPLQE